MLRRLLQRARLLLRGMWWMLTMGIGAGGSCGGWG